MNISLQTASIGHEMLPVQQPILLSGGAVPPLNVFHNPIWMNQQKPEENPMDIEHLSQLSKQLDEELNKLKPNARQPIQQYGKI